MYKTKLERKSALIEFRPFPLVGPSILTIKTKCRTQTSSSQVCIPNNCHLKICQSEDLEDNHQLFFNILDSINVTHSFKIAQINLIYFLSISFIFKNIINDFIWTKRTASFTWITSAKSLMSTVGRESLRQNLTASKMIWTAGEAKPIIFPAILSMWNAGKSPFLTFHVSMMTSSAG